MRLHSILSSSAVLAALGLAIMGGCGGSPEEGGDGYDSTLRDGELNAAPGLNMSPDQIPGGKITICHVPPGNPANAHTITVGSQAWNGHRNHKNDYMGPCGDSGGPDGGTPPPPPPGGGDGETPDAGTPPDSTPDAGTPPPPPPGPTCSPSGGSCGGEVTCCDGLQCSGSTCEPIIN